MIGPENHPGEFHQEADFSQALLESLGAGVFGVDRAGDFIFLNPAAVTLFGFTSQEAVLGLNSHQLTHHTDPAGEPFPSPACRIHQVIATGEPLEEWRDLFWRSDNTSFPVEVFANPVVGRDGSPRGAVVVFHDISERIQRERTLAQYQAAFAASRDAVMLAGTGGFLECNPASVQLFEAADAQTLHGLHPGELSPPTQEDGTPSREAAQRRIDEAFARGSSFFEWTHHTLKGRTFPAEVLLSRVDLEDGPILEALVRDISDKKTAMAELEKARNLAWQYFEAARVMNLVLDPQGNIREINSRGCELLGLRREAILGRNWFDGFLPEGERDRLRQVFEGFFSGEIHPGGNLENEVLVDGERRLFSFRYTLIHRGHEEAPALLSSGEDITNQRRMEADLEYRATNDVLTGLFNRRKFEEMLEQELERNGRYGTQFSLVMFDVDHFKAVNDNHGHETGDRILRRLAETVGQRIRATDILGRWGGEEFMVLLPETGPAGAARLAESIRIKVAESDFPGPGRITISMGVVSPQAKERRRDLTKRADDALYRAKAAGRNQVVAA
jgi:diguanylate cyclase (GGDEF)-like protein/PAS domain S-box-containing protein